MRANSCLPLVAGLILAGSALCGLPSLAQAQSVQPAPSFSQVAAAPDDPGLNLRFALAAAQSDDLLAAEFALERILIVQPGWNSARLLYAVVLYRLQDYQGADLQMKLVDDSKLTDLEKGEAARYRGLIAQERSPGRLRGQMSLGMTYDDDVTGALNALPVITTSSGGASGEAALSLDGRWNLGDDGLHLLGSVDAYGRFRASGPNNDLQIGGVSAGVGGTERLADWRIGLTARDYRLFGDDYLTETGVAASASLRSSPSTTWTFSVDEAKQSFDEPGVTAVASVIGGTRDGDRYTSSVMVTRRLDSRRSVWGLIGAEKKTADYKPFGYTAPRVAAGFDLRWGQATVSGMTDLRWVRYDQADVNFLFGAVRRETRSRSRLSLSAPLSAFTKAGATGDLLDRVSLQGAVDYVRRNAAAPETDYDSWGAELSLIWRFGAVQ